MLFFHKPVHHLPVADLLDQLLQVAGRFFARVSRLQHGRAERRRDLHRPQRDLAAELAVLPEGRDDQQDAADHARDADPHVQVVRLVVDHVADLQAVGHGCERRGRVVQDADDSRLRAFADGARGGAVDQRCRGQEGKLIDAADERGERVAEGAVAGAHVGGAEHHRLAEDALLREGPEGRACVGDGGARGHELR